MRTVMRTILRLDVIKKHMPLYFLYAVCLWHDPLVFSGTTTSSPARVQCSIFKCFFKRRASISAVFSTLNQTPVQPCVRVKSLRASRTPQAKRYGKCTFVRRCEIYTMIEILNPISS